MIKNPYEKIERCLYLRYFLLCDRAQYLGKEWGGMAQESGPGGWDLHLHLTQEQREGSWSGPRLKSAVNGFLWEEPNSWRLRNLPKQCRELGAKCSNGWALGRHFSFKPLYPLYRKLPNCIHKFKDFISTGISCSQADPHNQCIPSENSKRFC